MKKYRDVKLNTELGTEEEAEELEMEENETVEAVETAGEAVSEEVVLDEE